VFIRSKSLDAKDNEPDFVYVNTHIINKITPLGVDRPQRKSYGGINPLGRVREGAKCLGIGDNVMSPLWDIITV
jgi:hypothetical protein